MIDNGATSTWEHWNGARSRIHNCYNGIGTWFYQAIGGIVPDENSPAYRHLFINPQLAKGITWANTKKETPYGTVSVNWKLEKETFIMEIMIPVGAEATVSLPQGAKTCRLNGKSLTNNETFMKIGSGKYMFTCRM